MSVRKRLGDILLEQGLVSRHELAEALDYQRMWGLPLGKIMVAHGFISESQLVKALGDSLGLPVVSLRGVGIDKDILRLVPETFAVEHSVVPLRLEKEQNGREVLVLAMAEPQNLQIIDSVRFSSGKSVRPVLATFTEINDIHRRFFGFAEVDTSVSGELTILGPLGEDRFTVLEAEVVETSPNRETEARAAAEELGDTLPGVRVEDLLAQGVAEVDIPKALTPATPQPTRRPVPRPPAGPGHSEDLVRAFVRMCVKKGVFTREEFTAEVARGPGAD